MQTCSECGREQRPSTPTDMDIFWTLRTSGLRPRMVCSTCYQATTGHVPLGPREINERRQRAAEHPAQLTLGLPE